MILPAIPIFRRRRQSVRRTPPQPAPPAALMLVGASFSAATMILRLTFNKPVDVSGIFPGNLTVNDGVSGARWEGVNPTPVDPSTVDVEMSQFAVQAYPDTRLNTIQPTGVVAVDDAQEWPGVVNLLLPFP